VVIDIDADDKSFRRAVGNLSKTVSSDLKSVERAFSKTGGALTRYVTAPMLAATGATIAFGVKTAASFEQADIAFETLLGSGEAAKKMFDDLKEFAAKTPFEIPGLLDATKRLLAYGFAAQEVIPMLTSVGDAAAGLGLGTDGLNRIIVALGQMRAKGAVQAEEMRQLAEAGIPAWDALAKKLGVTIPEAMKLVEERAVDSGTAIAAVTGMMDERFGGMMLRQATTLSGLWSNLKDVFSIKLGEGFQANAEPLKDVLEELIDVSGPLVDSLMPAFVAVLEELLPIIRKGADLLKAFADADDETQETVLKLIAALALLGPALKLTAGGIGTVNAVLGIMASARVATALGNWSAAFQLVTANAGTSATALAGLSAQTAAVSAGYVALAGAAGYAIGSLINSIPAVEQTTDALAEAAAESQNLGEYLKANAEREKTWVDYLLPGIANTQVLAGAMATLTNEHKAQQVLTDEAVAQLEEWGIELDENNNITERGQKQLEARNAAMRQGTEDTDDNTRSLGILTDATNDAGAADEYAARAKDDYVRAMDGQKVAADSLAGIERTMAELVNAAAEADMAAAEATRAYNESLKENGAKSAETEKLRQRMEDATWRAADANAELNEEAATLNINLDEIPKPSTSDQAAWEAYYKAIAEKAAAAASAAERANSALSRRGSAYVDRSNPNIPVYGTGGHVTRPHLAVVGDKPEYIINPKAPNAASLINAAIADMGARFSPGPVASAALSSVRSSSLTIGEGAVAIYTHAGMSARDVADVVDTRLRDIVRNAGMIGGRP